VQAKQHNLDAQNVRSAGIVCEPVEQRSTAKIHAGLFVFDIDFMPYC
jgi:hypothetical protein